MDIDIIGSILKFMPPEELLNNLLISSIASKSVLLHYAFTPAEIGVIGTETTKDNIVTLSKNVNIDPNAVLILSNVHQHHDMVIKIISGVPGRIKNETIDLLLQHNCLRKNIKMVKFLLLYVEEYDYKTCIEPLCEKGDSNILYCLIDSSNFPEVLFNYAINESVKLGVDNLSDLLIRYPYYEVSIKTFTFFDRETCTILSKCHRVNHSKSKSNLLPYCLANGWYDVAKNILTPVAKGLNPRINHDEALSLIFIISNVEKINKNDNLDVARRLISLGLDPSIDNSKCFTRAVDSGYLEGVIFLLKDTRINPDNRNNGPIKSAVLSGNLEIVKLLLGDKRVNIWSCIPKTMNSLIFSSQKSKKHQDTLLYVLNFLTLYIKRIKLDEKDINAVLSSVFIYACKHENLPVIKILSPWIILRPINKALCGFTYNNISVVSYLMKLRGFDPTCNDNCMLKSIIRNGKFDLFNLMIEDKRIKVKESDLIYCVYKNNVFITIQILKKGPITRSTIEKVLIATSKQRKALDVYRIIHISQSTFSLEDQVYFMLHHRLNRVLIYALRGLGIYKKIKSTKLRDELIKKYKNWRWFNAL